LAVWWKSFKAHASILLQVEVGPHPSWQGTMSLTVFLALCILGLDFMIYMLFQWTYGEKRRAIARKVAAHRKAFEEQSPRPFLVQTATQDHLGVGLSRKSSLPR
jgi:hypothetical protein